MTRRDLLGAAVGGAVAAPAVAQISQPAPAAAPLPEERTFLLVVNTGSDFSDHFYPYPARSLEDAVEQHKRDCESGPSHLGVYRGYLRGVEAGYTLLFAEGVTKNVCQYNFPFTHHHRLWRVEWGLRTIFVAADDMVAAQRAVGKWCEMGGECLSSIELAGTLWGRD